MTGRDLILYILENNLENKPIFENGRFIGLINAGEAAAKMNVGVETIKLWVKFGRLQGVQIGEELYFLPSMLCKDLRE